MWQLSAPSDDQGPASQHSKMREAGLAKVHLSIHRMHTLTMLPGQLILTNIGP